MIINAVGMELLSHTCNKASMHRFPSGSMWSILPKYTESDIREADSNLKALLLSVQEILGMCLTHKPFLPRLSLTQSVLLSTCG